MHWPVWSMEQAEAQYKNWMDVNINLIPQGDHGPLVYWGKNEARFAEVADVAEGFVLCPPSQTDTE